MIKQRGDRRSGTTASMALVRMLVVCSLLAACAGTTTTKAAQEKQAVDPGHPMRGTIQPRLGKLPKATDKNERVVFLREGSIWMMAANGSSPEQLTQRGSQGPDESPAFSPDGKHIAYIAVQNDEHRLFVMSVDELIPTPLTKGLVGGAAEPCWSPDGKRIAFMRGQSRESRDLVIVDRQGKNISVVVQGNDDLPNLAGAPTWSPDGTSIVIAADRRRGQGTVLWKVDLASKTLTQLTPSAKGAWHVHDQQPAWSPDGTRVVFSSNRHATNPDQGDDMDLYSIAADGSGLTRLSDDPGSATDPTYSPDGKRIFFISTRDRKHPYESEIYVMSAAGGEQRRLTRDPRPQNKAPSAGTAK